MLAVIDSGAPINAINKLKRYVDEVFCFKSTGVTYNSISSHPDIFIYQDNGNIMLAPNTPYDLKSFLKSNNIQFETGNKLIGESLEDSVPYNCVSTDKYFIHKKGFSDEKIIKANKEKDFINIPQAYTRCSLISIDNEHYISSDKGIIKASEKKDLNCFYFSPEEITIVDHKNGFFGGTCGLINKKIFFIGNIDLHKDGKKLRKYLDSLKIEIICLSDAHLYDGGGIFFFENN